MPYWPYRTSQSQPPRYDDTRRTGATNTQSATMEEKMNKLTEEMKQLEEKENQLKSSLGEINQKLNERKREFKELKEQLEKEKDSSIGMSNLEYLGLRLSGHDDTRRTGATNTQSATREENNVGLTKKIQEQEETNKLLLRNERAENQKQKDQLQSVNNQLCDTLNEVKTELETQKDQLLQKLQDVETKRKKNKEEVQMVEKKITEIKNSDDNDLVLKKKENLLQSQWKLDEEKKLFERQILNIEKVMEPIEMQMMRMMEKDKDV